MVTTAQYPTRRPDLAPPLFLKKEVETRKGGRKKEKKKKFQRSLLHSSF